MSSSRTFRVCCSNQIDRLIGRLTPQVANQAHIVSLVYEPAWVNRLFVNVRAIHWQNKRKMHNLPKTLGELVILLWS
jgi:hypothetical protein